MIFTWLLPYVEFLRSHMTHFTVKHWDGGSSLLSICKNAHWVWSKLFLSQCKHISPYSLDSYSSMHRLCVRDMQKSAGPLYTPSGWQFLFVVEEPCWFGLWSHQHTGLVLVCDHNLKHKGAKMRRLRKRFKRINLTCHCESGSGGARRVYRAGGLHPRLPVYLHRQGFLCPGKTRGVVRTIRGCSNPRGEPTPRAIVMWASSTKKKNRQSKSNGAAQKCDTLTHVGAQRSTLPDGDLGGFGQPHGALEAGVDLTHLHGAFKADHLQPTVTQI